MALYGMDKVVPQAQFPFPPIERLITPLGNISRFTLFWSSMGTSPFYTFFAGTLEVAAAICLLFSRTALLGALLATAAMTNVAALNIGFDIPVKVFSLHLLALAIFLLAPDLARVAKFLLTSTPITTPSARFRWLRLALKAVVVVYILGTCVQAGLAIRHTRLVRSPLYGIYDVAEFTQDGAVRPPLTTDTIRWRRVVFGSPETISIQRMDDSTQRSPAKYDASKGTLSVMANTNNGGGILTCTRPDPEHLVLEGVYREKKVLVKLNRVDETKLPLVKSHIHWIAGQ